MVPASSFFRIERIPMAMMDKETMDDRMEEPMPMEGEGEKASIFLSKASLGNKQCKPGDMLSLKVTDVDPETGDVEAMLEGYEHKGKSDGYEADFDRAMPPEESEMNNGY